MSLQLVSLEIDNAALLMRRWTEARVRFDQSRVDFGRFDSLAKLVARMHREKCRAALSRPAYVAAQAA